MVEVELDPVAAHVPEQVDQRRDRRIEQRHHRREHDEREANRRFPPRARLAVTSTAKLGFNPHSSQACNALPARS